MGNGVHNVANVERMSICLRRACSSAAQVRSCHRNEVSGLQSSHTPGPGIIQEPCKRAVTDFSGITKEATFR